MAEWYTVERVAPGMRSTTSVIGYPFAFVPVSVYGDPDRRLRCYPEVKPAGIPSEFDAFYELRWCPQGSDDEVDATGWYLTGVGHHLLWCGEVIEDAVDAAQEHIAWDGSDPYNLTPLPLNEVYPMLIPVITDEWFYEDLWCGVFTQKRRYPTKPGRRH